MMDVLDRVELDMDEVKILAQNLFAIKLNGVQVNTIFSFEKSGCDIKLKMYASESDYDKYFNLEVTKITVCLYDATGKQVDEHVYQTYNTRFSHAINYKVDASATVDPLVYDLNFRLWSI